MQDMLLTCFASEPCTSADIRLNGVKVHHMVCFLLTAAHLERVCNLSNHA